VAGLTLCDAQITVSKSQWNR